MIRHKPSFVVDDETGATFPPTNAGGIYVANGAAFRVASVDLAALYASSDNRYKLVAKDTALKKVEGWIDVADDAEALGSELIVDGSFDNWTLDDLDDWIETASSDASEEAGAGAYGGAGSSAKVTVTDSYDGIYQIISVTAGKLYKGTFAYKNTAGDIGAYSIYDNDNSQYIINITDLTSSTSWITAPSFYIIAPIGCSSIWYTFRAKTNGDIVWFDAASFKEVTHVGTDGVLIMSTKGGATQSWALESGVDLNDIATFEVQRATRHHSL